MKHLPNFFHVGQPKAGSTSLHFMLVNHPDVCLVQSKEAHFFDVDENYHRGMDYYSDTHFSHCAAQKIVGDITPAYFQDTSLERIAAEFGESAKITVCFRFPVARTISHYFHDVRLLSQRRSLESQLKPSCEYIGPSMGGHILEKIFDLFPHENVMPLVFERDFVRNGANVAYGRVCNFLGIKPIKNHSNERKGVGFLPSIVIADHRGTVIDYRGVQKYNKGDIVIETLQWTTHYKAEVLADPSRDMVKQHTGFFDEVTTFVDNKTLRDVNAEYFVADVRKIKALLNDDLPEWNMDEMEITAPALIETRIPRKS